MTALCYNTLAQGLLSGTCTAERRFSGSDVRQRSHLFREPLLSRGLSCAGALGVVAQRTGRTPAQVAIRWVLDTLPGSCVIVGIKSVAQAAENTRPGPPLTAGELDELTLALEGAV
jgi:aryl-alcohol dehydrogenase-like predicted oxidoreductase